MPESRGRILIVEDHFLIEQYLRTCVVEFGFEVCGWAKSASSAVEMALEEKPDAILMDLRLIGDGDGVDAAQAIYKEHKCRIIYVTGSNEPPAIERMKDDHPYAILLKPIVPADLYQALDGL